MGFGINPLLIDTTANTVERRNFARPATNDSSFAQTLTETKPFPSYPQQTPSIENTEKTTSPEKTTGTEKTTSTEKTSGTSSIKPSLSPRFNKSPAYFDTEDNDLSFSDVVDFLNPFQHIPVLGTLYREMTGDEIKPSVHVAGDLVYGALTGTVLLNAASSVANAAYEQETGKEPAVQVAQALFGDDASPASQPIVVASADTKQAETATPTTAKQPFGGVMAPANQTPAMTAIPAAQTPVNTPTQQTVEKSALVAAASTAQSPRLGNKIYTSGTFKNATRLSAVSTAAKQASTDNAKAALTASATATSPLLNDKADSKKLGQIMHQSADAASTNSKLPPDLVQDMMLMALDKYKTASGLAPSEMEINKLN